MEKFRYKVSLRFSSKVVDPSEISGRLGLTPRISHRMGDARSTPKGAPLKGVYSTNQCLFELAPRRGELLGAMLERTVDDLECHSELFLQVAESGGTSEFFIGWFSPQNSGATFDHQLLRKLADLRIDLALDVYGES